jgi:hypothetical protein
MDGEGRSATAATKQSYLVHVWGGRAHPLARQPDRVIFLIPPSSPPFPRNKDYWLLQLARAPETSRGCCSSQAVPEQIDRYVVRLTQRGEEKPFLSKSMHGWQGRPHPIAVRPAVLLRAAAAAEGAW